MKRQDFYVKPMCDSLRATFIVADILAIKLLQSVCHRNCTPHVLV